MPRVEDIAGERTKAHDASRELEQLSVDAVVVGAGIAGMYAVYRLRELGLSLRGIEAGADVGGTWYWNRYPGCRCDLPILEYSYSFDETLQQDWHFTEKMATQPEIERYLQHVADRFDLRPSFVFETKVTSAVYDEGTGRWTVLTDRGDRYTAKYCVMATGGLSAPNLPNIPGIERFEGTILHTGLWPREGAELDGRRVGVIGTGSSGIQAIPQIAAVAEKLTVFQRTPNFAFPGAPAPMPEDLETYIKANYDELRRLQRSSRLGLSGMSMPRDDGTEEFVGSGALIDYSDFAVPEINRQLREVFETMVRSRVDDPAVAEALIPKDYPFGCKRLIVEMGYFETFNRPNVRLVDLRQTPIHEVTETGIRVGDEIIPLDALVLATGFDVLTGTLSRIEIRGRGQQSLKDKWQNGPKAYLGLMTAGFPNMFTITGPGSPSVISNVMVSIEQHVDWISDAIHHLEAKGFSTMEADEAAEDQWMREVAEVAAGTVFTAPSCNSFYLGANIAGKARVFMPYAGGVGQYREVCDAVAADGYRGFRIQD